MLHVNERRSDAAEQLIKGFKRPPVGMRSLDKNWFTDALLRRPIFR